MSPALFLFEVLKMGKLKNHMHIFRPSLQHL